LSNIKGSIKKEAVIINNSLALDHFDLNRIIQAEVKKVKTSAEMRIIKGTFVGDYDEETDSYIGMFRSVNGNYFLFSNSSVLDIWDADPKAKRDVVSFNFN
jgi:hypothetical protein